MGTAIRRARNPLVWVALAYAVGVSAGVVAVHAGNPFALRERDRIVGNAVVHDPASLALARGERVSAALFDFLGNLGRGAVPYTVMGLGVVFPFPFLAFAMPKGRYGYPGSDRWLGLPSDGVRDVLWIYTLVVPLFLLASLTEFLTG